MARSASTELRVGCDVAEQFPIPIICALLGTPRRDWQLFSDWVTDIKKLFDWNLAGDAACILNAWQALDDYLEDMVASRRHTLTDDLISELIRAEDAGGDKLDHDELLSLAVALLGAGTDTTRHQLAAAVDLFCDHPDPWALLGEQPELAPRAVGEVMRYRPIGFALPRIATEDIDLAGMLIPAGTIVFANTVAANRDPAAFTRSLAVDDRGHRTRHRSDRLRPTTDRLAPGNTSTLSLCRNIFRRRVVRFHRPVGSHLR